ncbi:MAG: hypothetical protein ACI8TQ_000596 [Planctomycetota bacterium]|jgi:hypothetical protein
MRGACPLPNSPSMFLPIEVSQSMSLTLSPFRSVLLAVALVLTSSCTARDNGLTTIVPQGADTTVDSVAVTGQIISVAGPAPVVDIVIFLDGTKIQSAFTTRSEESGRYKVEGLPPGNYRFTFTPPTPDSNDPATNLRTVHIGNVEVTSANMELPLVIFAPVVEGGMLISNANASDQVYQFRVDPKNLGSAVVPGLENMGFKVRAFTQMRFFGFTLTQLGIDDDTSNTGLDVLVEMAIIRADQLPAAHIDADGESRTSQVYYQLYPAGFDFVFSNNNPNELEIDYPNVNGLSNVFTSPQLAFSHLSRTWEQAGVLDVDFDGVQAVTLNFDGIEQSGIVVAPGPPPPTTIVTGQILNGTTPVSRAGIRVVTNSGFQGFTNSQGIYRIEDVPIPLNCTDLIATAYTDRDLIFAVASNSARPTYPSTTIDIDLPTVLLVAPTCDLANSEPTAGSVGIETNERVRLRFTGEMSLSSLQSAITVVATGDDSVAADISGTIVAELVDMGGGVFHTDAFFISDAPLPINSNVVISVATSAENTDGMALAAACSLTYRTGTSTLFNPRIDVMEPRLGTVGTIVTLHGINLDIASLTFDAQTLEATTKSATKFTFTIQVIKGDEPPGPRVVQLDPGAVMDSFVIIPRIDAVQIDDDPDLLVENLVEVGSGNPGTSTPGVDSNDGTLLIISGQNLFDVGSGLMPVVSFGFGDGDPTGATDGDAAIDGPDEAADELRLDVHVPPMATAGELTVIVDDGNGTTFTSPPVTFVVELPFDQTAPVVDTGSFDPPANSNGNPTNQIIRVEYDEALSGNSRLLIGAGSPLRVLPGTTRVTTSLDGKTGILEFISESGSLPASSTIQVQLANTTIFDLAGNPSNNLTYLFSTGSTEPGGGTPPAGDGLRDFVSESLVPIAKAVENSESSVDGQFELPDTALRALELGSRLEAEFRSTTDPATRQVLKSEQAPFFAMKAGLVGEFLVEDWSAHLPVVSWKTESLKGAPQAEAFYAVHNAGIDGDGVLKVESSMRFDLKGEIPDPSRHIFRFELSVPETGKQLTGLVSDLNENGKFELSLYSNSIGGIGVLAREDLILVGDDFIEFRIPPHAPLSLAGDRDVEAQIWIESFDPVSASYFSSPFIQFRSN